MTDEKMLTVSEAADYLGIHVKTVRSWADKGWVASVRWPNGWRYFRQADLDEMRQRLAGGSARAGAQGKAAA